MTKRVCVVLIAVLCMGVSALETMAAGLSLEVVNQSEVGLRRGIVTGGVPFPKGTLKDVSGLTVSVNGKAIPAQFRKTVPWDDGSIRWALLDTQVPLGAGKSIELTLSNSGGNPEPASPLSVKENEQAIGVSTGPLVWISNKNKPGLVHSIRVDGKELVTGEGLGPILITADGEQVQASAPSEVILEESGPMRAVICLKGGFPGVHNDLLKYTARITLFAGRKIAKVHFWLENHGADGHKKVEPEWFAFEAMGLDFGLGLGDAISAECEGAKGSGDFKILQVCKRGEKSPYFTLEDYVYTVTHNGEVAKQGKQTDGLVSLSGNDGSLNVAVRHFWQNYEKAIEKSGKRLKIWLWPEEGEWPRPTNKNRRYRRSFRLRRLKGVVREGKYLLPGSAHKGHEFILDFSGGTTAQTAVELNGPLFPRAKADYYAETRALPEFFMSDKVDTGNKLTNFKLSNCANMSKRAVDPEDEGGIYAAREISKSFNIGYHSDQTYWYGWMDFGDICVPGRGHVSLRGDWPLLVMYEYLRNGKPAAFELALQMTRHRIDIDQYWSDRDPPIMNGVQSGTVWPSFHADGRGGGYASGGTFIAGPALWYMLTGEQKAKEASLRSAEGLVRAWEIIQEKKVYGGGLKVNMEANANTINSFCAAYDLTADKRWLDEAMKLFNNNVVREWKSHGPHLHSPGLGQLQGQGYAKKDQAYCHAIGPLCNLHRHTGNAKVLELLTAGCEKELDSSTYFDAPIFLAGLYSYVGRVTNNPDYIKTAAKKFGMGFSESRKPPVFLPDSNRWYTRSAGYIRAGAVLEYGFQD
ncbi:MAG: hypothetical protein ACOC6C_00495 [Verrucomicrobiota bacterium]